MNLISKKKFLTLAGTALLHHNKQAQYSRSLKAHILQFRDLTLALTITVKITFANSLGPGPPSYPQGRINTTTASYPANNFPYTPCTHQVERHPTDNRKDPNILR